MRTPLLVATASLVLTGCAASEPNHLAFGPLLETIERRLDLAQAVALHKWDNGQPVQASTRERQVVANVRAAAAEYGLAAERAEAFSLTRSRQTNWCSTHCFSTGNAWAQHQTSRAATCNGKSALNWTSYRAPCSGNWPTSTGANRKTAPLS